jgi:hypothetical protein
LLELAVLLLKLPETPELGRPRPPNFFGEDGDLVALFRGGSTR